MDCTPSKRCHTYYGGSTWTEAKEEEREAKGSEWPGERKGKTCKQTPPRGCPYAGGRDRGAEGRRREGRPPLSCHCRSFVLTTCSQKRRERIERLKDDPYYIFDKKELEKPTLSTPSDVDSIPIVRLD